MVNGDETTRVVMGCEKGEKSMHKHYQGYVEFRNPIVPPDTFAGLNRQCPLMLVLFDLVHCSLFQQLEGSRETGQAAGQEQLNFP
jgi:hypothetical protein